MKRKNQTQRKDKANKILSIVIRMYLWIWSISFIVGGSLLIGAGKEIKMGANALAFGFFFNLGIFIYYYWRKK